MHQDKEIHSGTLRGVRYHPRTRENMASAASLCFVLCCCFQVYERAIANVPPVVEKRYWRRYIYLWINYALFEELQAEDAQRTR